MWFSAACFLDGITIAGLVLVVGRGRTVELAEVSKIGTGVISLLKGLESSELVEAETEWKYVVIRLCFLGVDGCFGINITADASQ